MSPRLLHRTTKLGFCSLGLLGCMLTTAPEGPGLTLTSAGGEPLTRLPLVPRLHLRGSVPIDPVDLWLLRGGASEKDLGQIVASAPGEAILERRVPLSVWASDGGLTLAPMIVLETSQEYTLVALSVGELAQVTTSPSPSPIWWRWGTGAAVPGGWLVHCAEPPPWVLERWDASSAASGELPEVVGQRSLEPVGAVVDILPGFADISASESAPGAPVESILGASGCVRFRAPQTVGTMLPPHEIAGRFFEPTPLVIAPATGQTEQPAPDEVRVVGSAAYVDLPAVVAGLSLARLESEQASPLEQGVFVQTPGPSSLLLGQFERGAYSLFLSTVDARGDLLTRSMSFEIVEERGQPVLSEVLANPFGPEPESEWVEVVNIGRAPLDLDGFLLEDSGGASELPAVTLPPGGVGLVVRYDFVAGASGDLAPSANAIPILVDELCDGGLTNSGEVVRLRARDGQPVSEIPAAAAVAGQSLARRHLLAPDWPTSFGPHAGPGASPGAANVVD